MAFDWIGTNGNGDKKTPKYDASYVTAIREMKAASETLITLVLETLGLAATPRTLTLAKRIRTKMELVDLIISYENGELSRDDTIDFFQKLLDSGTIYSLQGTYQRTAQSMLDEGLISLRGKSGHATGKKVEGGANG